MSSDPVPSASLITRAQAGDDEAYDQLFARAADRLLLFVRMRLGKRLRNEAESLDVLQDAYLEAHRHFEGFRGGGEDGFARWVCRIIENRLRGLADYHGAQKRQADGERVPISRILDRVRASGTGPVTVAARLEKREHLESALSDLPEDEREVMLLRFLGEHTIDDIAELTGRSASAVRRVIGRATLRAGAAIRALRADDAEATS